MSGYLPNLLIMNLLKINSNSFYNPFHFCLTIFLVFGATAYASESPVERQINQVIKTAESYLGTPHKMGGLNSKGIDCSGLMVKSFAKANIQLPRASYQQAKEGKSIKRKSIERGDLVFFRQGSRVDHVGLVISTYNGDVEFIHTSSSRGVMISRLSEPYWTRNYHSAKRLWKGNYSFSDTPPVATAEPVIVGHLSDLNLPGKFPEASQRLISQRELKKMSSKNRTLMKYEILARHGYVFPNKKVQKYFQKQAWYRALPKVKSTSKVKRKLSKIERKNIKRLS